MKKFPYPLSQLIFNRLLKNGNIVVFDCGASAGGEYNRWENLGKYLELHCFEADEEECERLQKKDNPHDVNVIYSNQCIGKSEESREFNVAKDIWSSSFLKLDMSWYSRKKTILEGGSKIPSSKAMETEKVINMSTISLDDYCQSKNINSLDHLKIDIEGLELETLEASPNSVKKILGISIDVIFHRDWHGAPLFSEIDDFLRKKGFYLWDLNGIKRNYQLACPVDFPTNHNKYMGQISCANAVYLRDPIDNKDEVMSVEDVLKLACIAEVHGLIEYAFELIIYAKKIDENIASQLDTIIVEGEALYKQRLGQEKVRNVLMPVAEKVHKVMPKAIWTNIISPFTNYLIKLVSK